MVYKRVQGVPPPPPPGLTQELNVSDFKKECLKAVGRIYAQLVEKRQGRVSVLSLEISHVYFMRPVFTPGGFNVSDVKDV